MVVEYKNKGFEGLEVWQKAKALAVEVYKITESFPHKEQFGLTNQIRRSAISVISNIAEGSARGSDKEFARFILIALGSIAELKAQLIVSREIGFLQEIYYAQLISEIDAIGRMLKGLKNSIVKKAA